MTLQLNEPNELELYKAFSGSNTEKMSELIAEGKILSSFSGLIRRRLEVEGLSEKVRDNWQHNHFDSGDLWLRHPFGKGKIVLYDQKVHAFLEENIYQGVELIDGALPLPDGMYEQFDGLELSKSDIERHHGKEFPAGQARHNFIWQYLTRNETFEEGNILLLDKYEDLVTKKIRVNKSMKLFFGSVKKVPILRLWYLDGIDYGSDADGDLNFDYDFSRLLGVMPEAREINL